MIAFDDDEVQALHAAHDGEEGRRHVAGLTDVIVLLQGAEALEPSASGAARNAALSRLHPAGYHTRCPTGSFPN